MTDYSHHTEEVTAPDPTIGRSGTVNDHGRGASLWDRKEQGATRAPVDEAMPVSPYIGDPDFKY